MIAIETYHEVMELLRQGLSHREIARRMPVSYFTVGNMAAGRWSAERKPRAAKHRPRFRRPERGERPKDYLPTPEEIALACAEIRAAWSAEEFAVRKAFNPDEPRGWRAPRWSNQQLVAA